MRFQNALADKNLLQHKDYLADQLKVKYFHLSKYKHKKFIGELSPKIVFSNWEHVQISEICEKFTEWTINVKFLKYKILVLLHENIIILTKNVSHVYSTNILWRKVTYCQIILDRNKWEKSKEKDDWGTNVFL